MGDTDKKHGSRFKPSEPAPKLKASPSSSLSQFEIELGRCREVLNAAAEAYKKSNFTQAEELYHAALAGLEQVYAGDSAAVADCLTGLADSYYKQNKFGLALPLYQRQLGMRDRLQESTPAAIVTAHFKVAKTHEKLKEYDEAAHYYKKSVEIAQRKLILGHPLLTALLESYAAFLHSNFPEKGLGGDMDKLARSSREKYVDPDKLTKNILEGLFEPPPTRKEEEAVPSGPSIWLWQDDPRMANNRLIKFLRKIKENPSQAQAFMLLPLLIGSIILLASASYYLLGGESVQRPLVHAGEVYDTVDGHKSIEVLPENRLRIVDFGNHILPRYSTVSNAWRQLYFSFSGEKADSWILMQNNALVMPDGVVLHHRNDLDRKLFTQMRVVSQKLNEVWTEQRRKTNDVTTNDDWKHIATLLEYENPYTKRKEAPALNICKWKKYDDKAWVGQPFENLDGINSYQILFDAVYGKQDAAIKCFLVRDEDPTRQGIFLLGKDGSGTLLRTCSGNRHFMIYRTPVGPLKTNCDAKPANGGATIFDTIISNSTQDEMRRLSTLVAWDLLLLVPIVVAGRILMPNFFKIWRWTRKDEVKEHFALIVYLHLLTAYILFTICVLIWGITLG